MITSIKLFINHNIDYKIDELKTLKLTEAICIKTNLF